MAPSSPSPGRSDNKAALPSPSPAHLLTYAAFVLLSQRTPRSLLSISRSLHSAPPTMARRLTQRAPRTLSYASLSLRALLESLVADITCREGGRPPVCIISDIFFGWAVDVAKAFGTRNYSFTTCGAYGTSAHVPLWLHFPRRWTESSKFVVPVFPERCLFDKSHLVVMIREADEKDMWSRFLQPPFELSLSSGGWLCNTSEEFEPLGAAALRNLVKLPVWTIGPLLPDAIVRDDDSSGSLNFISEHQPEKPLGITSE